MNLKIKNSGYYLSAIIFGGLQALSFAPTPSGLLQIISLAALLFLLPYVDKPARIAFTFGMAWFCAGLYWLHFSMHDAGGLPSWMSVLGVALVSCYLASFYVIVLWLWQRFFMARQVVNYFVAFPALWLVAELMRGYLFGGFPWLVSGYAHIDNTLLKGWFAIFGVYGVGFVAAVFAGALAFVGRSMIEKKIKNKELVVIFIYITLFSTAGLVVQGLNWGEKSGSPVSIKIVQPNVPQTIKFDETEISNNTHLFLEQATQSTAQLTVFPETALPYAWTDVPIDQLKTLHASLQARAVLMGGVGIDEKKQKFYNSAIWLTADGNLNDPPRYDKNHLLPFGEMVPWGFQWLVKAMKIPLGGYGYGTTMPPFELKVKGQTTRIGVNICYENEFGEELLKAWEKGDAVAPNIWVNMTNLGWFGTVNESTAQEQHLSMSRARALEMARPVIVATNTGISAYISAAGVVVNQLQPDVAVSETVQVQGMQGVTPYIGWGNIPMLGLVCFLLSLSVFLRVRQ